MKDIYPERPFLGESLGKFICLRVFIAASISIQVSYVMKLHTPAMSEDEPAMKSKFSRIIKHLSEGAGCCLDQCLE